MNPRIYQSWAALADDASKKTLTSLRETATKWATFLTTLTTLLATVGVTLSPTVLAGRSVMLGPFDLTPDLPGILLVILLAFVVATLYATFAAQGIPKWVGLEPEPFRRAYLAETVRVYQRLNISRTATAVALGGLLLYAAMVLFSKEQPARFVQATTDKGVYCGTLFEGADGLTGIRTVNGRTISSPVISALAPVENCFRLVAPAAP